MKIKEQTRKLAAGCSKYSFEVVDETDEVRSLGQKSLVSKKSNGFAVAFLHGYDSLGKIELHNKPFRKAIPCIFTITQIKQLYH